MSILKLNIKYILRILIFLLLTQNIFSQKKKKSFLWGELPNKLQYFITPTNLHNKEIVIHFVINIGSIIENNNQLGFAHFLEHMAFKKGKRLKKSITLFLKEQGLQIGKHYNAVTNYNYTSYEIILPNGLTNKKLNTIIIFFADILNGLSIKQKDINSEKKIVFAEKKYRKPNNELFKTKIGNGLYANRIPIGTTKSLSKINSKTLNTFYKKWYQPKFAAIFIAGKVNEFDVKKLITKNLSEIHNSSIKKPKISLYKNLNNSVTTKLINSNKTKKFSLNIAINKNEFLNNPTDSISLLTKKILYQRLKSLFVDKLNYFQIKHSHFLNDVNYFTINGNLIVDEKIVLKIIFNELNKIQKLGISNKEYNYYLSKIKTYKQKNTSNLQIIENQKKSFWDKKNNYKNSTYKEKCTKLAVINFCKFLLTKTKMLLYIEKPIKSQLTTKKIKKYLIELKNEKVKPHIFSIPKQEMTKKENYELKTKNLKPNLPIHKSYFKKLNITQLFYKNGLEILLKPIKSSDNELRFFGIYEGGTSSLSNKMYLKLESTVSYIDLGGVGNLNSKELEIYLDDKNMGLSLSISEYNRYLYGYTELKNKENFFKYLFLKLTSARKNYTEFNKIIKDEILNLNNDSSNNLSSTADFKIAELSNNFFKNRTIPNSKEGFESLNLENMLKYYNRSFSNANNLKLVIVGNFKIEEIEKLINLYLSNLYYSKKPIKNKLLFNMNMFKNIYTYKYISHSKNVINTFLVYGNFVANLKNSLEISLFKKFIHDKLIILLREKHGFVYTPIVSVEKHINTKSFFIVKIIFSCDQKMDEKANKLVLIFLKSLKNIKISPKDFMNYKKQLSLKYKQIINSKNTFKWSSNLQISLKNKESIKDLENYDSILNSININDIKKNIINKLNINNIKKVKQVPQ